MPAILREDGYVVRIYGPPRDHPPPHVHVERGREATVVIRLGIARGGLSVRTVHHMHDHDVVRALRITERHQDELLQVWGTMHGDAGTD